MAKRLVTTINEDLKNGHVTLVIEHDVASSFSRSVRPKFNTEYRSWAARTGNYSAAPTVSADLGAEFTLDTAEQPYAERRCISVFFVTL